MLTIGLTGGIASGKSTVADLFKSYGITIIDADAIAREVVMTGTKGLQRVVDHFGEDVLQKDGSLNREKLRQHIFDEKAARIQLEKILHPLIRERMHEKIQKARPPYCIAVIPLLIENLPNELIDRVLVIDCDETLQIDRLMQRDNITKEAAQKILANQSTREQRLNAANDVIENQGDLSSLQAQVTALHNAYKLLHS